MAIYLVDYENDKNLIGINNLSDDDYVIIFYSCKANSLTFDLHKEILSSKATIEYKCVDVGVQNALDFQLSSYLGYLIKQNENSECKYYIVTKDGGYSYVKSFWEKEKSADIQLISDLAGKQYNASIESPKRVKKQEQDITIENPATNGDIKQLLKESNLGLTDDEIKEVVKNITKYKTTTTINSNLNKLFKDSAKTGEILKLIRPFIKKKK